MPLETGPRPTHVLIAAMVLLKKVKNMEYMANAYCTSRSSPWTGNEHMMAYLHLPTLRIMYFKD